MGSLPAKTTGKTALITGITGHDGSYLAELLLEKGYMVHGLARKALENSSSHPAVAGGFETVLLPCRHVEPNEVYNLAAQSHVGLSFKPELTAAASRLGELILLKAIQEAGLTDIVRFFEASSCEIFAHASAEPMAERSPLHPQTPYGKSKLLAFLAVKHYRESYSMYACSGILFNHELPRRRECFVTRKISQVAVNIKLGKQRTLCLGNSDAQRDWGHARDYVHCMWLELQQQKPADFVRGTGINTSVRQFVELALECVGLPIRWEGPKDVEEVGVPAQGLDPGRVLVTICPDFFRPVEGTMMGNTSKASAELGWRRDITVRQLVNEMVDADMALTVDPQKQH